RKILQRRKRGTRQAALPCCAGNHAASSLHRLSVFVYCGHDSRMRGASAENVRHGLLNLTVGRTWIPIEEGLGGHDDAVDAKTALHGLFVDEGLLDRVRFFDGPKTLEGRDFRLSCDRFDRSHA